MKGLRSVFTFQNLNRNVKNSDCRLPLIGLSLLRISLLKNPDYSPSFANLDIVITNYLLKSFQYAF
jgi:hypothetical protein